MVFAQEIELDLVANGCLEGVRDVHQTGSASYCYLKAIE